MSFRDNLQYLRSQRGMTQEQLAMLLGVSRQSISKWESEKAYPEMDKLLMICDMFGCTLDDLVLGDVRSPGMTGTAATAATAAAVAVSSAAQQAAVGSKPDARTGAAARTQVGFNAGSAAAGGRDVVISADTVQAAAYNAPNDPPMRGTAPLGTELAQDVTGYDEHRKGFAWKIALGVSAMAAGVALGMLFDDKNSIIGVSPMNSFLLVLCIMLGVVVGLSLIIPAGLEHAEFKRRHPYVENFYIDADRARASRSLAIGVVAGIAMILFGVVILTYAGDVLRIESGWPTALMLAACALGVGSFVYFGIMYGFMDLDQYNQEAKNEDLLRGSTATNDDFYGKLAGSACGIIMLIATIIGLWMLFTGGTVARWQNGDVFIGNIPFWIPWPIGGVLCGIVNIIAGIFRTASSHRNGK